MTQLYAFGQDPRAFYSQSLGSVAVENLDGSITWSSLSQPMKVHTGLKSAASDGTVWISVGGGYGSSSTNPAHTWLDYSIWQGWTNLTKIVHNGAEFYAVGFVKNSSNRDEQATVFTTNDGADSSVWVQQFLYPNSYSGFCDIASLGGSQLIAVGYQNGLNNALVAFTSDGIIWQTLDLDPQLTGAIFSVSYDAVSNRIWLGGQGWIATGLWNQTATQFSISRNLRSNGKPRAVTAIANNGNQVVACQASNAWFSSNGTDWYAAAQPGYNFESAAWFANKWYLGCTSTLNQYTGFVMTINGLSPSLVGFNNGVQATSLFTV